MRMRLLRWLGTSISITGTDAADAHEASDSSGASVFAHLMRERGKFGKFASNDAGLSLLLGVCL